MFGRITYELLLDVFRDLFFPLLALFLFDGLFMLLRHY